LTRTRQVQDGLQPIGECQQLFWLIGVDRQPELVNRTLLVAFDEQEHAFRQLRATFQARRRALLGDWLLDNDTRGSAPQG
jgi:hypothetical protein